MDWWFVVLVADKKVTGVLAQAFQRGLATGLDTHVCAGRHDFGPDLPSVPWVEVDLIAELACIAHPREEAIYAGNLRLDEPVVSDALMFVVG